MHVLVLLDDDVKERQSLDDFEVINGERLQPRLLEERSIKHLPKPIQSIVDDQEILDGITRIVAHLALHHMVTACYVAEIGLCARDLQEDEGGGARRATGSALWAAGLFYDPKLWHNSRFLRQHESRLKTNRSLSVPGPKWALGAAGLGRLRDTLGPDNWRLKLASLCAAGARSPHYLARALSLDEIHKSQKTKARAAQRRESIVRKVSRMLLQLPTRGIDSYPVRAASHALDAFADAGLLVSRQASRLSAVVLLSAANIEFKKLLWELIARMARTRVLILSLSREKETEAETELARAIDLEQELVHLLDLTLLMMKDLDLVSAPKARRRSLAVERELQSMKSDLSEQVLQVRKLQQEPDLLMQAPRERGRIKQFAREVASEMEHILERALVLARFPGPVLPVEPTPESELDSALEQVQALVRSRTRLRPSAIKRDKELALEKTRELELERELVLAVDRQTFRAAALLPTDMRKEWHQGLETAETHFVTQSGRETLIELRRSLDKDPQPLSQEISDRWAEVIVPSVGLSSLELKKLDRAWSRIMGQKPVAPPHTTPGFEQRTVSSLGYAALHAATAGPEPYLLGLESKPENAEAMARKAACEWINALKDDPDADQLTIESLTYADQREPPLLMVRSHPEDREVIHKASKELSSLATGLVMSSTGNLEPRILPEMQSEYPECIRARQDLAACLDARSALLRSWKNEQLHLLAFPVTIPSSGLIKEYIGCYTQALASVWNLHGLIDTEEGQDILSSLIRLDTIYQDLPERGRVVRVLPWHPLLLRHRSGLDQLLLDPGMVYKGLVFAEEHDPLPIIALGPGDPVLECEDPRRWLRVYAEAVPGSGIARTARSQAAYQARLYGREELAMQRPVHVELCFAADQRQAAAVADAMPRASNVHITLRGPLPSGVDDTLRRRARRAGGLSNSRFSSLPQLTYSFETGINEVKGAIPDPKWPQLTDLIVLHDVSQPRPLPISPRLEQAVKEWATQPTHADTRAVLADPFEYPDDPVPLAVQLLITTLWTGARTTRLISTTAAARELDNTVAAMRKRAARSVVVGVRPSGLTGRFASTKRDRNKNWSTAAVETVRIEGDAVDIVQVLGVEAESSDRPGAAVARRVMGRRWSRRIQNDIDLVLDAASRGDMILVLERAVESLLDDTARQTLLEREAVSARPAAPILMQVSIKPDDGSTPYLKISVLMNDQEDVDLMRFRLRPALENATRIMGQADDPSGISGLIRRCVSARLLTAVESSCLVPKQAPLLAVLRWGAPEVEIDFKTMDLAETGKTKETPLAWSRLGPFLERFMTAAGDFGQTLHSFSESCKNGGDQLWCEALAASVRAGSVWLIRKLSPVSDTLFGMLAEDQRHSFVETLIRCDFSEELSEALCDWFAHFILWCRKDSMALEAMERFCIETKSMTSDRLNALICLAAMGRRSPAETLARALAGKDGETSAQLSAYAIAERASEIPVAVRRQLYRAAADSHALSQAAQRKLVERLDPGSR
jgi:hypothetical protein